MIAFLTTTLAVLALTLWLTSRRNRPRLPLMLSLIATSAFSIGFALTLLWDGPPVLTWLVLRTGIAVAVGLTMVFSFAPQRTLAPGLSAYGHWTPRILDGIVLSATLFAVLWVALSALGYPTGFTVFTQVGPGIWIPLDAIGLAAAVALTIGTQTLVQSAARFGTLSMALLLACDVLWARTSAPDAAPSQAPTLALVLATLGMLTFAITVVLMPSATIEPAILLTSPPGSPSATWGHLLSVPALFITLLFITADPVALAAGVILGLGVIARLLYQDQDNHQIWGHLATRATTDELTGTLNRATFLEKMQEHLTSGRVATVCLDLDGFKMINDRAGHLGGDDLLRQFGAILGAALPGDSLAGRMGGDEFAVLIPVSEQRSAPELEHVAINFSQTLLDQVTNDPGFQGIGLSLGITTLQRTDAELMLGDADLAMREAKRDGGCLWRQFTPGMRQAAQERTRMRAGLTAALAEGHLTSPYDVTCIGQHSSFELYVQPVVGLPDGHLTGFEALLRWREGATLHGPDTFLPVAAETGLILPIGEWVLRQSLTWLAARNDLGNDIGIAVNTVAEQIVDPTFVTTVQQALEDTGIRPSRLTLEVTEQTAVEHLLQAAQILEPLRKLGVHLALDDFGTGFSSLRYLSRLPVDVLKIDRSFVSGLGQRTEDETLVRTVIRMAFDLGLDVIAEGVETPEQAQFLYRTGCRIAQGYHFHRPIPAAEYPEQVSDSTG